MEAAEANETGRHAAYHGTGFRRWVAVVQNVPHDRLARGHQRQGAGRGHAEVVHCFAAKEFSNGGAQHGFAVGGARIGRQAGAFELQFEEALVRLDFAQCDGSTVAQLSGPVAELMAAVALGVGFHPLNGWSATEHHAVFAALLEAQHLAHFSRPEGEVWRRGGRWLHPRPALTGNLAWPTANDVITRCLAEKAGVPRQVLQ